MADETRTSGSPEDPSDSDYGRPVLVPVLALAAVVLAVAAVMVVDSPDARVAMGFATLGCVIGCALRWGLAWGRRGGTLTVGDRITNWAREHASAVVFTLSALALAFAVAKNWSVWVTAPLSGVVAGVVMWHQHFERFFRIAGAVAMTLAVITIVVLPGWAALAAIALIALVYLPILFAGQTKLINAAARRLDGRVNRRDVRVRYGRLLGRILISALLFVGAIVGTALVAGAVVKEANPSFDVLRASAFTIALVVAGVVCWWWRSYEMVVLSHQEPGFLTGSLLGVVVVGLAIGVLGAEAPDEGHPPEVIQAARDAARGQFDLVLVVDPGEPVGRALIARANLELDRPVAAGDAPRSLFAPRIAGSPYDVEYAIAVPQAGDKEPLHIVEPPTSDARELLDALAGLTPRPGGAADALRRVARDGVDASLVESWRPDAGRSVRRPAALRGVAFLLDRLPVPPAQPEAKREPGGVALHVVTRERRETRLKAWRASALRTGGELAARGARPPRPTRSPTGETARTLLLDATDLHTGVPVGPLHEAAWKHRPVLLFDGDVKRDPLRPVDVDWLLATERPPRERNAQDVQKVCERAGLRLTCDEISSAGSLAGSLDDFIDLSDAGRRRPPDSSERSRMYVHVRSIKRRIYLGYWWFLRYNSSPWRGEVNCLPGLSFGAISCHDHEGDWEGVTVVLDRGTKKPVAAVYDAHGREIRWDWPMLRRRGERPLVFVAAGSHASYPESCARRECDQRLGHEPIGDGGFDGTSSWSLNKDEMCEDRDQDGLKDDPCLVALPSVGAGRDGVLWNAFLSRWGGAQCTPYGRVCSQVNGPLSPSQQERFRYPCTATAGPTDDLSRYRKRRKAWEASNSHPATARTSESVISGEVEEWACPEAPAKPAT